MAKIEQQDSGEERVTAKSRPMMSLIARAPSTLSSSASESPVKKSNGSQSPWSAKAEKNDGTRQPVVDRDVYSARYSRWDDDKAWINRWMLERDKKIWSRTMVISRFLVERKSCILSVQIVHKVNGTKWRRR